MRILAVNKFWYRRGGQERVMFDEIAWLETSGHNVAHFSTSHPQNEPSPWSTYFAPYLELGSDSSATRTEQALAVARMFWNATAARQFTRLLRDFHPDIVHVHGIHRQISPSILWAAKRVGIPVVHTLHDHSLLCAEDVLLRKGSRTCIPPKCTRTNVLPCISNQCVQRSTVRSALAAAELVWRRSVLRRGTPVSAYIAPSHHLAKMIADGKITRCPIRVLPNAIATKPIATVPDSGEFVFAGRLSQEKGLVTLMRAVARADVRLVVAGDGPLSASLKSQAPKGVRFAGSLDGPAIDGLLASCRAAVVPSQCVENAPMAVLEAMRQGRPVIASRVGGIPEQIRDGREGILFSAGSELELAAALRVLHQQPALADRLGRSGRQRVATLFTPQAHLDGLLRIYNDALQRPESA